MAHAIGHLIHSKLNHSDTGICSFDPGLFQHSIFPPSKFSLTKVARMLFCMLILQFSYGLSFAFCVFQYTATMKNASNHVNCVPEILKSFFNKARILGVYF